MKCDEHLGFSAPTGSFVASLCIFVSGCHVLQGHSGSESHHSFAFFFCCWYVSIPTTLTNVDPTFTLNKITQVRGGCFSKPSQTASVLTFLHMQHTSLSAPDVLCLCSCTSQYVCGPIKLRVITTPPPPQQTHKRAAQFAMTTEIKAIKHDLSRKGRSKFAHSPLSSAMWSFIHAYLFVCYPV